MITARNSNYQDVQMTFTLTSGEVEKYTKEYENWKQLYLEEKDKTEQLLQEAQESIPAVYYNVLTKVVQIYNMRAEIYYRKAESTTDINRAIQYMKRAYTIQKRANQIIEVFIQKFGSE